jgi:hypothetical protein
MKKDALEIAQPQSLQCLAVEQLAGHIESVRQIQAQVMRKDHHYGTIPGCGDKPTLFKAGAELVLMTFQIHLTDIVVEDLSTDDEIRYRVKTVGATPDGVVRGIGIGEASTSEEKYKWRRSVSDAEYDQTPASRRREKHGYDRKKRQAYTTKQVRTNPADSANTILKMAKKRSYVDLTLTATAASEVFTQDVEDQPLARRGTPPPKSRPADLTGGFQDNKPAENLACGKVEAVTEERTGTGGNGPWTLWGIWVNGEVHKTFKDEMAERARAAEADGRGVEIAFEVSNYGRDALSLDLAPMDGPPPSTDASGQEPPDDEDPPPHGDDEIPF